MNHNHRTIILVLLMFGVLTIGLSVFNESQKKVTHFQLTDQNGNTVTESNYDNKYLAIFFGYTACPDICPTTLETLSKALDLMPTLSQSRYQILFITLDPVHDKPDVLKHYTEIFNHGIIGLTGSDQQIATLARQFDIYYKKVQEGPHAANYSIEHDAVLFILDPKGNIVERLLPTLSPQLMAEHLQNLISHPNS